MSEHKHAKNMILYAQDWMETDEPWKRWESRQAGYSIWNPLMTHPSWHIGVEYRRKLSTIIVNGIEVPAPETRAPREGTYYYTADIIVEELYGEQLWRDDSLDRRMLERGLIHLIKENAIAHAKAMLAWKKGGEEQ